MRCPVCGGTENDHADHRCPLDGVPVDRWQFTAPAPKPRRKLDVNIELRVRAYSMGYIAGAQVNAHGSNKRTTVDPDTHEDWRAGFDAGREAAGNAADAYRERLYNAKG